MMQCDFFVFTGKFKDIYHDYKYTYQGCGILLIVSSVFLFAGMGLNYRLLAKEKKEEERRARLGGSEGCGKGACCCQSVCLLRPCPLPPRAACPPAAVISWLSSGKETAKQGTVYLCRLYSLHIPAAGLRHHSNLPGSAKKGPTDLLSTTVCIEVPGVQINRRQCPCSVQHCRPDNPSLPQLSYPRSASN